MTCSEMSRMPKLKFDQHRYSVLRRQRKFCEKIENCLQNFKELAKLVDCYIGTLSLSLYVGKHKLTRFF